MADQADTLRKLMRDRERGAQDPSAQSGYFPQVITIASGREGVGKTCLTANLGLAFARSGLKVILVNCSPEGSREQANLDDLLQCKKGALGRKTLSGLLEPPEFKNRVLWAETNLWFLPASAGLNEIRSIDSKDRESVLSSLGTLPVVADVILVDAGAGLEPNVISLHHPENESVIVLTPDSQTLCDSSKLIRQVRRRRGVGRVTVIVNRVTDGREGRKVFQNFQGLSDQFMDVDLEYLGHWEQDEKVSQSVEKRRILLDLDPEAPSASCIKLLAKRLRSKCMDGGESAHLAPGNTARFWKTLLCEEIA